MKVYATNSSPREQETWPCNHIWSSRTVVAKQWVRDNDGTAKKPKLFLPRVVSEKGHMPVCRRCPFQLLCLNDPKNTTAALRFSDLVLAHEKAGDS